ncbi:MAG TPA: hypothetical protein VLX32_13365 [Candidatus Acidoferrum sp.]|nr:hypothetical protein [Candidatus Acidoferrum sp.]
MPDKRPRIRIVAILLAILFLGAQLHFCADFNAGPTSTHIRSVCSTATSVIATSAPVISLVALANHCEPVSVISFLPPGFRQTSSSRAPPLV